jgi:hypothetical protein
MPSETRKKFLRVLATIPLVILFSPFIALAIPLIVLALFLDLITRLANFAIDGEWKGLD